MSTPQTTVYICRGVRLNSRYEHAIYFKSNVAQEEYFSGKVVKTLPAYTYVRRSWTLKVEVEDFCDALNWNYVYFRYPKDFRYYYFFINKVEYVNDVTAELHLELDLLTTYGQDIGFGDCIVEREHVELDGFGEHTLDEGLDTGEYVSVYPEDISGGTLAPSAVMILATFNPQTTTSEANAVTSGGKYNDVYSGLGLYAVHELHFNYLTKWIQEHPVLATEGILAMWAFPHTHIKLAGDDTWETDLWCHIVGDIGPGFDPMKYYTYTPVEYFADPSSPKNYTPKNKKLLCYPYNILHVHNNNGGAANYRFERFKNPSEIKFAGISAYSPDSSVRIIPCDYNINSSNKADTRLMNEYGLTLPPYPTCAWNSDTYKLWLANNQAAQSASMNSANISAVGSAVSVLAGIAGLAAAPFTGGASTALTISGVAGIAGGTLGMISAGNQAQAVIARDEVASIQPDQAKGSYSATINCAHGIQTFTACQKQITIERAKIIDGYFSMYGYKVNRFGKPRLWNRKRFTYVKTKGCIVYSIRGAIPNEDITKIEAIFDKGVTYWVNGDDIGNYSTDNGLLTGDDME